MGTRSDLTGGDAAPETPQESPRHRPAKVDGSALVARRHRFGRVGVIALGVAMITLGVVMITLVVARGVTWGSGGETSLPAEAAPSPGDELAEIDVAGADGPTGLPGIDPRELTAPVHTVTTACDLIVRDFPSSSTYGVISDAVATEDGPTVCSAQPLADGRLIATVGYGTADPSVGIIDPRRPADGHRSAPAALSDALFVGSDTRVVGSVEHSGEVLVARGPLGSDDAGSGLVAVDVDSGEEREVLEPGAVGGPESVIGAAQLRDDHLVVVTGEPSAMGPNALAGIGHRGSEPTQIWFGPAGGDLVPIRQPMTLPETDEEVLWRDLLPPRIVDGPDGPLVASFEHVRTNDVWQLVVIAPDGATRVVAELGDPDTTDRSTAQLRTEVANRLGGAGAGGSFDASGSQMLIAGAVAGDSEDSLDDAQTVLLLDLADGTWSRLPVEANVAAFVHTDR